MEIRLVDNEWHCNGYVILGNKEDGYDIYYEEKYDSYDNCEPIESDDDFEKCLTWIWNS